MEALINTLVEGVLALLLVMGDGKFIAARSVPINGITNPLVLEAMAARESLKICFGIGFSRYRD